MPNEGEGKEVNRDRTPKEPPAKEPTAKEVREAVEKVVEGVERINDFNRPKRP